MQRRSAPQTVSWFVDLFHGDQLDLDPEYQRRSVWNLEYRQYFIDTILRNYPSPSVFLQVEIRSRGKTLYHVVDGKQRLTAILDFMQDKYETSETHSGADVGGKYYSELTPERQKEFLRYVIPVESLEEATPVEMEQAFDRLNRNVARLNAQELRNARFSGTFIKLVEALADDPFWSNVGLATTARIRRMLDIEFVSEVFILSMHGIQDGKGCLDQFYADYDSEIPDVDQHRRRYENCKTLITNLWPHISSTRFRNLADFYSLWAACVAVLGTGREVDVEASGAQLSEFAESVRSAEATGEAQKYLVAATQGSNKGANREVRAETLVKQFRFRE